jgi:hypothetical protein
MRWLRRHRQVGGAVALLALALQFAASFAHVHAAPGHDANPLAEVASGPASPSHGHADEDDAAGGRHHSDRQPCDICAALTLGGAGQIASPPSLVLPRVAAAETLFAADPVVVTRRHSPAQSRAPPTV